LQESSRLTGIREFDEAVGGGFDRGSIVLLEGAPGVGKSIFAAKFVYNGAVLYNEKGIYASFISSKKTFYRHMKTLNMDFLELERKGLFKYFDLPTVVEKESLTSIILTVFESVLEFEAKRIVIDPITFVADMLTPSELRSFILNILRRYIEEMGSTVILISAEIKTGRRPSQSLKFIADVVLIMRIKDPKEETREIKIVKFRGRKVKKRIIEVKLTNI